MQRIKTIALVILYSFSLTYFMYCNRDKKKQLTKAQVTFDSRPYVNGEILLPDYAHDDTLIVLNAAALNYAFDGVDNPAPATDWEIDSTLNQYCRQLHTNDSQNTADYGLDVDMTGYTIWDGSRMVAHFPFDHNPVLDSIIYKDND